MSNQIVDLPVPAGNGVGAAVDVSNLSRDKTVSIRGSFNAIVVIEGQPIAGAAWSALESVNGPTKVKIPVAVTNMRVRIKGFQSGTPNVDVAAEVGQLMAVQPVVPASGTGAASSIVDFPQALTIFCTGSFSDAISVQVSLDGTSWSTCAQFVSQGGVKNVTVTAAQVRVLRSGSGGTPEVTVAAITGPASAGASNVTLTNGGGAVTTLNVRTTGDDETGNGSLTAPYRTIQRALQDIPVFLEGRRFVINCDTLGINGSTQPLVIGPHFSSDDIDFSGGTIPGFTQRGSITIEATPTVIDTFTPTGNTPDATTGLQTYQTTLNLTLNQYQGRLVRDANNVLGVIGSNTAGPNSDIEVAENTVLVGPIEVLDQAVEIQNTDAGGSNAVIVRGCQVPVVFNGVRITAANPSVFTVGLLGEGLTRPLVCVGCDVGGYFFNGSAQRANQPSLSDCNFTKRLAVNGVSLAHFGGVAIGVTSIGFRFPISSDVIFFQEMIMDGCSVVGGGTGIDLTNPVYFNIDRVAYRNGTGDGFFFPDGRSRVRRTTIDGCVGDAIQAEGPGTNVVLDTVQGSGNGGLGLNLDNGAHAQRLGASAPTGTGGDYQVGSNVVGTWGAFGGNEVDATVQLCRLFT